MTEHDDLKYTPEHEWLRIDGDLVTVGITDYAASKLGDVVFVDLPDVGATVTRGKVIAEVESTKSVGEVYAPVDGTIESVNDDVADRPELINESPFGEGWLFTLRAASADVFDSANLLSRDAYQETVAE